MTCVLKTVKLLGVITEALNKWERNNIYGPEDSRLLRCYFIPN